MHAVSDIGAMVDWLQEHVSLGTESKDNLALLHNQNDMVRDFGMSAWVTQSNQKQKVISRSVTSCAGMTAYMVIVAQTRVGCLSGGRRAKFRNLPTAERLTQMEEAYARATVALTRARRICIIFVPLDMKGLIGAATVMGSLMYGAGHCWQGRVNVHLRHPDLTDCPTDESFVENLTRNSEVASKPYPPVALAESVSDATLKCYKIRRLHLIIVDLWRPWKVNQEQVKSLTSLMKHLEASEFTPCTTPMMPYGQNAPLHCRRFVYGYSLDGSLSKEISGSWGRKLADTLISVWPPFCTGAAALL